MAGDFKVHQAPLAYVVDPDARIARAQVLRSAESLTKLMNDR